jgi:hypothetical protein
MKTYESIVAKARKLAAIIAPDSGASEGDTWSRSAGKIDNGFLLA